MNEMEWSIGALHIIAHDVDKAMLNFAKFIGSCSTLPWNMYGIHIHEQNNHLIFIG